MTCDCCLLCNADPYPSSPEQAAMQNGEDPSYSAGDFGDFVSDVSKGNLSAAVNEVQKDVIDPIAQATAKFANTAFGKVVLTALSTSVFGPLAQVVGPQLASAAFALPGVAKGDDFGKAWLNAVGERVKDAANIAGPDIAKGVADAIEPASDALNKLGEDLSNVNLPINLSDLTNKAQSFLDQNPSIVNGIPIPNFTKMRDDATMWVVAQAKGILPPPDINIDPFTGKVTARSASPAQAALGIPVVPPVFPQIGAAAYVQAPIGPYARGDSGIITQSTPSALVIQGAHGLFPVPLQLLAAAPPSNVSANVKWTAPPAGLPLTLKWSSPMNAAPAMSPSPAWSRVQWVSYYTTPGSRATFASPAPSAPGSAPSRGPAAAASMLVNPVASAQAPLAGPMPINITNLAPPAVFAPAPSPIKANVPAAVDPSTNTPSISASLAKVTFDLNGNLGMSSATMSAMNEILATLKANPTMKASAPPSVITWLLNHAIAPTRLTIDPGPVVKPLVAQIPISPTGALVLSSAAMSALNGLLAFMKANPPAVITVPPAIAQWLMNHAISANRLLRA